MTDIEIARNAEKKDIRKIAEKIGVKEDELILYGYDKAKVNKVCGARKGKLILVTATNPTPFGEGKTTVSIGLEDALCNLGKNAIAALREPSMGPVFGMKGGATGGGMSQVIPMEDINLHFTGDFHAITSANNLLSSAIDNHIYHGNKLEIEKVVFNRCLDVNDRTLRNISLKTREESFNITAASELMALFCLATSSTDLKEKLGSIIVGYTKENKVIYAKDLNIEGAMATLLNDAFKPNLVQTLENNPVLIHGGPFANIAHGCNSIAATNLALSQADYVVTEAGFGSDLGAEKFFDIKCRKANLKPDCVVLVTTVKALKYNSGILMSDVAKENIESVQKGLSNLIAHYENMKKFNSNIVICLNKYDTDSDKEIDVVKKYCCDNNIAFAISTAYKDGGRGAVLLANEVLKQLETENKFSLLYEDNLSITEKIEKIAKEIYHAIDVEYTKIALEKIKQLESLDVADFPICIAKTQYSFSDDAKLLGNPTKHTIHVKDIVLYNGAGFITVLLGNIMTMPGLPSIPNYQKINVDDNGNIEGIF